MREPGEKGWQERWTPRAKKALWRQAEEYFKVNRDPKMVVTLPRVTLPELEEEPSQ